MIDQPTDQPIDEMSFEEALKALEGVVEALEGGKVPLEQSLDLYERGEKLRKHCEGRLKDAELRVEKIVSGSNGEAIGTAPLDEQAPNPATRGSGAGKGPGDAGQSGAGKGSPTADEEIPL